jgi:alkaline phosphatase
MQHAFARFWRVVIVITLLAAVVPFSLVSAQDEAPPVLILPIDQAQFLPGARFDFRVEVHAKELPADFAVTVNGQPAAEFFGAEGESESWEFGGSVVRFSNEGTPGPDFSIEQLVGSYYNSTFGKADITLEGETLTSTVVGETITLEATDNPLAFTVVGGQADGNVLTFGLDAEGAVTGFEILGQRFGRLAGALPTPSQSLIWRELVAPAPGEYVVEVVAGGNTTSVTWTVREPVTEGTARNVILFIADGMSVAMLTAARIMSQGVVQGNYQGEFVVDSWEAVGLAHTSSVDAVMADSANTASALNTGHVGSVNATGSYSDTSPNSLDDPRVETLGQMLKRLRGMSVGIVTTADFSDATPAAVWAHGRNRSSRNRADYVAQALAFQPEVLMGGGGRYMLPQSVEGSRRSDDRDMYAEFADAGYTTVTTATELNEALSAGTPERLLGVFHQSDMNVWLDRNVFTDNLGKFPDQPGLVDMTIAALEVLNQNPNGFYLEVEAGSVDKQMHPLDQERTLADLIEFFQAVEAAQQWVAENAPDTLLVVTSDHAHGYEVYGSVDVEAFNAATDDLGRRRAIGVYADGKYPTYVDEDNDGFPDDWNPSIVFAGVVNNHPEYTEDFQVSPVPRVPAIDNGEGIFVDNPDDDPNGIFMSGNLAPDDSTGVHTLQDVPVFATGPGALDFIGVYHQREIFFSMAAALGLNPADE